MRTLFFALFSFCLGHDVQNGQMECNQVLGHYEELG